MRVHKRMLSKLSFWHTFKVYCTHKYNKHLKKEGEPLFLCTHWLLVVLLLIQALNGLFSCISSSSSFSLPPSPPSPSLLSSFPPLAYLFPPFCIASEIFN